MENLLAEVCHLVVVTTKNLFEGMEELLRVELFVGRRKKGKELLVASDDVVRECKEDTVEILRVDLQL